MSSKREILVFIGISFGLAWPIVIVLDTLWPSSIKMAYLSHCSAMMMPGVACVIVRKWVSREGFSDCGLVVGRRLPYLIVVLATLLLWGSPKLADVLWGGGELGDYSTRLLLFTVAAFFLYLIPAFGEELGWRGYLLQRLLPMGTRKAVLLHGCVWGAWHWSLVIAQVLNGSLIGPEQVAEITRYGWTPEAAKALLVVAGLVTGMLGMVVVCALIGVIAAWLRLRFGSVYLATVGHAYYDYFRDVPAMWFRPGRLFAAGVGLPNLVILPFAIVLFLRGRFRQESAR